MNSWRIKFGTSGTSWVHTLQIPMQPAQDAFAACSPALLTRALASIMCKRVATLSRFSNPGSCAPRLVSASPPAPVLSLSCTQVFLLLAQQEFDDCLHAWCHVWMKINAGTMLLFFFQFLCLSLSLALSGAQHGGGHHGLLLFGVSRHLSTLQGSVSCPVLQVPRDNMRDKDCYWKRCDESAATFTTIARTLQDAEIDVKWRLEGGEHGDLAAEIMNFAATRPHVHLIGFPTPRIMQELGATPRAAEAAAEERPSGSGARPDVSD